MDSQEKINTLRKIIDDYDDQILNLLIKRFSISKDIGDIKKANGLEIDDPTREQEIIIQLSNKLKGVLDEEDIAAIFSPIYQISKKLQTRDS